MKNFIVLIACALSFPVSAQHSSMTQESSEMSKKIDAAIRATDDDGFIQRRKAYETALEKERKSGSGVSVLVPRTKSGVLESALSNDEYRPALKSAVEVKPKSK